MILHNIKYKIGSINRFVSIIVVCRSKKREIKDAAREAIICRKDGCTFIQLGDKMIIKNNEEFVGKLSAVQAQDGKHKLTFIVMNEVEIPEGAISIHRLHALEGQRIGLIRIDSGYRTRKIPDKR